MQNPKNNGYCLAITTQCGKEIVDPPMPIIDEPNNDSVGVNETLEAYLEKAIGVDDNVKKDKGN